jgi:hypothetical protein
MRIGSMRGDNGRGLGKWKWDFDEILLGVMVYKASDDRSGSSISPQRRRGRGGSQR